MFIYMSDESITHQSASKYIPSYDIQCAVPKRYCLIKSASACMEKANSDKELQEVRGLLLPWMAISEIVIRLIFINKCANAGKMSYHKADA